MKLSRVGLLDLLLLVACLVVLFTNAWFAVPLARDALSLDALAVSIDEETQNVRRLGEIDDLSAFEKELAQLRARLAGAPEGAVPGNVDDMGLVYGLLDFVPASRARIVGFRELEVKSQAIDTVVFQLLSYEITLEGDPYDMLTMLKRVDQNALGSLTVPSVAFTKGEKEWNLRAMVVARLPIAVQPVPSRTAQPAAAAPAKSSPTPSPSPVRR